MNYRGDDLNTPNDIIHRAVVVRDDKSNYNRYAASIYLST